MNIEIFSCIALGAAGISLFVSMMTIAFVSKLVSALKELCNELKERS